MSIVAKNGTPRFTRSFLEQRLRDEFLTKLDPCHYPFISQCAVDVWIDPALMGYRENYPHEPQGFLHIYSTSRLDDTVQDFLNSEYVKVLCNGLTVQLTPGPGWTAASCVLEREYVFKGSASEELWRVALLEQRSEEEMKVFYKKHFEGRTIGRFNPYRSDWIECHESTAGGSNLFDCLAMNPCTRGGGKDFLITVIKQCLTTGSWEDKQACYRNGEIDSWDDVCIHYVGESFSA